MTGKIIPARDPKQCLRKCKTRQKTKTQNMSIAANSGLVVIPRTKRCHKTSNLTKSHHITHHNSHLTTSHIKEEVLGPSSWAGWQNTESHHITHHTVTSHHHLTTSLTSHHIIIDISPPSHHISHITHRRAQKHENYHIKPAKDHPRATKSTRITTKINIEEVEEPKSAKKYEFYCENRMRRTIPDQRKVRELPRKMNLAEVEEPKKYENYHAKPVSDPFKNIAEHRKVRELPRKMNIEEVEEPESTRICHVYAIHIRCQ